MDSFQIFFERVKNPLRKNALKSTRRNKSSVLKGVLTKVKNSEKFKRFESKFPDRAKRYLKSIEDKFKSKHFRKSLTPDNYHKERIAGFDVYFDKSLSLISDSKAFEKAKFRLFATISNAINFKLKGIVPIRKPKIVITDLSDVPGYRVGSTTPAEYFDRIIYIDEYQIHSEDILAHEYAHFIADRVNKQVEQLLRLAYDSMLDEYYKAAKKKRKSDLKDTQLDSPAEMRMKKSERQKIAKKLGFPSQYGLNDFDELFAEIITNWTTMPVNPITYKFKKIVKNIITRL